MTSLLHDFIYATHSPWLQLGIVALIFLTVLIRSRFSQGEAIELVIYVSWVWMPISMLFSLFAGAYWMYLLYWLLSVVAFLLLFVVAIIICEKYGSPYRGDGGLVTILPIYLFLATLAGSLLLKSMIVFVHWILG